MATKSWQQIGPIVNVEQNGYTAYPGLGRVNVVAVDVNNTQIMYAGAGAGGLWKTTDGGSTWIPKTDDFAGLGVTDIIIDPNNSSILYMATGDEDAQHISSIGVFKSTDAGDTWAVTGLIFTLDENEYVRDLSFAPGSSTTLFALTNNEIQKSSNSGATWQNMTTSPNYEGDSFQTIVFDPNDAAKVIVSDNWGGIWYSSDSGSNFAEHSVYQGATANKLKLTTSADDTDNFYGLLADVRDANDNITTEAKFIKFRFAIDDSANDKISEIDITGFNTQRGYNQCIAVSPSNSDDIIIGGVNGWKSTDNGATFSMFLNAYNSPPGVGFYVHPDHHHLSFLADGVTVINGHDGGVHKGLFSATAASGGWTDLTNGLVISQPYNISITQGINGDDYMMGNQDNDGFSKVFQTDANKWVACLAGDGTATGIDIGNSAIRYLGGTQGTLYRSDDGYATSWQPSAQILDNDADAAFVSPLALHPTVAATIYAGHSDVKKSIDRGANWTALSSGLTETSFLDVSLYNISATIRIFAIGDLGGNSTLRRSLNDGTTWSTIASPSGVTINSVYAVPNSDVVYATVSSYTSGSKVYKSTNNGTTWTNVSGDLPNIIMYKIIMDPNKTNETLYLGTELGMYFTDNSTTSWAKLGADLPNVRISDIEISKNNGNIYIGTFGRGLWVYDDQKYFDNVTDTNWSVTANWEGNTLPTATDDVFIKSTENVIVNTDGANVKSLEIEDGALLTINNTRDLTVEDDFTSGSANGVLQINSDANDSGVLIVKGTNATGIVTYVRGGLLGGNNEWSIISPPVIGQSIKTFAEDTDNAIKINTTPDPDRYAIAKYNDDNTVGNKWEYYDTTVGAAVNFDTGVGYAISRSSAGDVSFTGTIQKNTLNVAAAHDNWVAIGNPFSAYYPANKRDTGSLDFISNNTAKLADDAQAVYMWDDSQLKYVAIADLTASTQKVIAPGQGFFIKMKPSGTDEMVVFNNSNLGTKTSLSGTHTFSKDANSTPYLKLFVEKGTTKVSTHIIFSETATNGFDIGHDIINFGQSEFDVITQLVDKSDSKRYTIQSITKGDYENQIIPIGLKAKAASEIIFTASAFNLPDDIKMYMEDKEVNKFFDLSDNKNYKLTLNESIDGFGRFYAHFSKGALNIDKNVVNHIQILNQNNFIHIKGIDSGYLNIEIFDMNGKRIFKRDKNVDALNAIDLNNFSKGVYLVEVSADTRKASKKILIN